MGRRTFLGVLAGGAVAVAAGGAAVVWWLSDDSDDGAEAGRPTGDVDPRTGITTLLGDPAPAARIGVEYRKRHPAAPTVDVFQGSGGADQAALADHLSEQARTDWATDRTVIVAGWMLPRAVAELCATAAQEFPP